MTVRLLSYMAHYFRNLFGHGRDVPPVLIDALAESHRKAVASESHRHNVVDAQLQELTMRLDYLAMEAETDVGFRGHDGGRGNPADLHR